jgi:hypothetical protein
MCGKRDLPLLCPIILDIYMPSLNPTLTAISVAKVYMNAVGIPNQSRKVEKCFSAALIKSEALVVELAGL